MTFVMGDIILVCVQVVEDIIIIEIRRKILLRIYCLGGIWVRLGLFVLTTLLALVLTETN